MLYNHIRLKLCVAGFAITCCAKLCSNTVFRALFSLAFDFIMLRRVSSVAQCVLLRVKCGVQGLMKQ